MKKLLALILAVLMLLSCLVACGDGKNPAGSTPQSTPSQPSGGTPDETPDETPEEELLNIEKVNHDQKFVTIFHWESLEGQEEFDVAEDEIINNNVYDAIYQRNLQTEEHLGIHLGWHQEKGRYYEVTNFVTKLSTMVNDPMTPVDIIAAVSRNMPNILIEGYLTDLNNYTELDLDKVWWPENVNEGLEIKDRLYFISGDISPNTLRYMYVIFVNKTHLEARGTAYESFMEDIKAHKWTLDRLIEMTEGVYANRDEDPEPSVGDFFGFTTTYFFSDALYMGLGYKYMVQSNKDDEVFKISPNMLNQATSDYVTKLSDWNKTNDMFMDPAEKVYMPAFLNGNTLFTQNYAWFGVEIQDTDINYAVLPAPLLNENQDKYYTVTGINQSFYGICSQSPDAPLAAATIQVLGYNAYKYTTPAIFEVTFKGKFSKDDYTVQMFDIIREGITFDPGRLYDAFIAGGATGGYRANHIPNIVSWTIRDDLVWTTNFSPNKQAAIRKRIDDANKKILDIVNAEG